MARDHARTASRSPTLDGEPVRARSRRASTGTRSRPRRAATGTSCSRRSTSSRAPSPTRCAAASISRATRSMLPEIDARPGGGGEPPARACSSPAAPRITPRSPAAPCRAAGRPARRGRSRLASSGIATRSIGPETWWSRSGSRARPPTPWARVKAAQAQGRADRSASPTWSGSALAREADRRALHARRAPRSASRRPRRSRRRWSRAICSRSSSAGGAAPCREDAQEAPRRPRSSCPRLMEQTLELEPRLAELAARPRARARTSCSSAAASSTRSRSRARSSSRRSRTSTPRATRPAR